MTYQLRDSFPTEMEYQIKFSFLRKALVQIAYKKLVNNEVDSFAMFKKTLVQNRRNSST